MLQAIFPLKRQGLNFFSDHWARGFFSRSSSTLADALSLHARHTDEADNDNNSGHTTTNPLIR